MSAKRKPMPALDPAAFGRVAVPQADPVLAAVGALPPPPPAATPDAVAVGPQSAKAAYRVGKVQVQTWVPEETKKAVKILAVRLDLTMEEVLADAIAELLKRYQA